MKLTPWHLGPVNPRPAKQWFLSGLICSVMLSLIALPPRAVMAAASQDIYGDTLAAGWADWSWTTVNLQSTAEKHSGTYSIAVTYSAWGALSLHYPEFSTLGATYLRFFIHGGSAGGQHLSVYATYTVNGVVQNGPSKPVPAPVANTWTEVHILLSDLGVANATLNSLVWKDAIGSAQPTLYIDDIALAADVSADAPALSAGYLLPRAVPADGMTRAVVRAQVSDPQGLGDIASVTLHGNGLGQGPITMRDDGWSDDGAAGDGVYGAIFTVPNGTPSSEQTLVVAAQDYEGHSDSLRLGAFDVLGMAGGQIPAALPQHIGWGTNAWSETPGEDWQVNSGVPWDYVYQYIQYEWYRGDWGGNFVGRFVQQAWSKNYIPVVTVYLMVGLPPACGASGSCYATKLQNAQAVSTYLAALQKASLEARGTHPVIFHLEPDFYGFMQQLSNTDGRPAGVRPDDPSSYPVALNVPGYPNNLAGLGRRMVDVVHAAAPNALVAPHASMWATDTNQNLVTPAQVISIGQRTAAFIDTMGGAQSDLLTVEWADRDAGDSGGQWWDDTNLTLPRPTRAMLWESALSAAARKRLILWQMPVGNMSLANSQYHYQDNRAAYAFQHPRDLFDAAVFAVLFGGGQPYSTQVWTDDAGLVAAQGAIAYAPPAAPTGLAAGTSNGPVVPVRWNENTEPDIWGYRLRAQPAQGGSVFNYDAGRGNTLALMIPWAGNWRITVSAYDAMGNLSSASTAITVTTLIDARAVYLPLVRR